MQQRTLHSWPVFATLLVLVLGLWLGLPDGMDSAWAKAGDTAPVAAGRSADHMPMWFDLLHTTAGELDLSRRPVHGSHFGPEAPSFGGVIPFTSHPFGAKGPFELGNSDLALMRMGPEALPEIGEAVTFDVLIAAVSWHSSEPVLIDSGDGGALWNVEITLSEMAAQPLGEMTLRRDSRFGGTAEFKTNAFMQYRFYRGDGREVVVDAGKPGSNRGQVVFEGASIPWTVGCEGATVRPARLVDAICLGEDGSGTAPALELSAAPFRLSAQCATYGTVTTAARVSPAGFVAASTQLGAGATVAARAQVLGGGALGRGVTVEHGATVAEDALIGARTVVGAGAHVGRAAYIGERVQIGAGVRMEENVVVQSDTVLGERAEIAAGVYIGANVVIGDGAILETGARIGHDSTIGAGARVQAYVSVTPGTAVRPGVIQPVSNIQCLFPDYTWIATTPKDCAAQGGAIRGHLPPIPIARFGPSVSYRPETRQVTPSNGGGAGGQLGQDVDASGVAPANGGQAWTEDTHDCDDFADDLEQHLQGEGYNATFTCLWTANGEHEWYNWLWTDEWESGHCLTDVHNDDGTYTWIEPQWSAGQGAVGQNLDADGDGMVGISNGHGSSLTEGNTRIEVYGSAQEAQDAGVTLD